MEYVNKYCWCGTASKFRRTDKEAWLEKMCARYRRVAPFNLTENQKRAWSGCYDVLQSVFSELGDSYNGVHLIFEYGLPHFPPNGHGLVNRRYAIYPDCLIISKTEVVILEFKERDLSDRDLARKLSYSARRYRNRIQKYHDQSKGLRKRGVLVSTVNAGLCRDTIKGITLCSHDMLAEILREQLGEYPRSVESVKAWRESTYSIH